LSACNSEELNTSDTADGEIRLSAATIEGSTAVTTRTITPGSPKALTEGTAIALQVSGTWTGKSNPDIVKTPKATAADATIAGKSDLTLSPALYWDDFGTADPNNKDTGRANGLTIYGAAMDGVTTAPEVTSWTSLTWDLGANQTGGISAKDLLLSNNVSGTNSYKFSDSSKQLEFKHVLSKITVNILAGDGFDGKFTNAPEVVLTSNEANSTTNTEWAYTKGIFNVTTGELSLEETDLNTVTMAQAGTNGNTVTKEALVMPGSTFANDKAIILCINVDDNIYYITAKQIRTSISATHETDGAYETEAGKNYIFNVTVNKTGVTVTATVKEWEPVNSKEETPEISFSADVKSSDASAGTFSDGESFSLWMTTDLNNLGAAKTITSDGKKFVNTDPVFWPNGSDSQYFRALADYTTGKLAATTSYALSQGKDLLWGTTADHTGTEIDESKTHHYDEGVAINPRTGVVPLVFKHAMSYVAITLTTGDDKDPSHVDLTNAKVTFSNLVNDGTINIATGKITLGDVKAENDVKLSTEFSNLFMIPQTIGNNARLTITLDDGTTYSLQLNTCKDGSDTIIGAWDSGSKYTYTISLAKEAVKFRVLVQDWDEKEGSGNATLDWD
jgi:hypothetical protein